MSHPGEKFNQVSTHINGVKKTRGEIVNDPDDVILVGAKWRVAINDRQGHRCRSTTKIAVPSRGLSKQVTSLEDSFFSLRLVKPFHGACTEFFIGNLAHPTVTEGLLLAVHRVRMRTGLRIGIPRKCKKETVTHDIGRNNVSWPI